MGFSLLMLRVVLNGRADEVVDLAKVNLLGQADVRVDGLTVNKTDRIGVVFLMWVHHGETDSAEC